MLKVQNLPKIYLRYLRYEDVLCKEKHVIYTIIGGEVQYWDNIKTILQKYYRGTVQQE